MPKVLPEIHVDVDSPLLLNFQQSENNLPKNTNAAKENGKARDKNELNQSQKTKEPNVDIMNALNKIMSNLDGIKERVEENENERSKSN